MDSKEKELRMQLLEKLMQEMDAGAVDGLPTDEPSAAEEADVEEKLAAMDEPASLPETKDEELEMSDDDEDSPEDSRLVQRLKEMRRRKSTEE